MPDAAFSAFPAQSTVPIRLMKLATGKGTPHVRVHLHEAGDPGDARRDQLADFCDGYDLEVHHDPFRDYWTISRKPEPSLFDEVVS